MVFLLLFVLNNNGNSITYSSCYCGSHYSCYECLVHVLLSCSLLIVIVILGVWAVQYHVCVHIGSRELCRSCPTVKWWNEPLNIELEN